VAQNNNSSKEKLSVFPMEVKVFLFAGIFITLAPPLHHHMNRKLYCCKIFLS